jgi:cation:H+ antiporter
LIAVLSDWPTLGLLAGFFAAGVVIFLAGLRITTLADLLADRTGLGEAIIGAVLLGAATSFSGTIVSVTAALDGRASLAFANAVGGIAAQTMFLAVADMFYRHVNLEHAAADLINLFQGVVLFGLLSLPMIAMTTPEVTAWAIHPVSFAIPLIYGASLYVSRSVHHKPMWSPVLTADTRDDAPEVETARQRATSTRRLFLNFFMLMLLMGGAGWVIAQTASVLTDRMAISASLVGALATAVVTSLPELVTTIAAVRRGALQLAVGGIIGGNTFDMLFLPLSDISFREGSLYHAVGMQDYFWVVTAMLMTAVLLGGLLLRQQYGPARIGYESILLLLIYAGAVAIQVVIGLGV